MIVGLTGGIASGKTEVSDELRRQGAFVIDADRVAREVVEPGTPAYRSIVGHFGEGILSDDGRIDRAALAQAVFADDRNRALLNSVTHPAIFQEMARGLERYAECMGSGDVPAVIIDAALIVDAGISEIFDILLVVTATEEKRMQRLLEKRGMSEYEAAERISSQVGESERVALGDIIIENNGSLEELRRKVRGVWQEIAERARRRYS